MRCEAMPRPRKPALQSSSEHLQKLRAAVRFVRSLRENLSPSTSLLPLISASFPSVGKTAVCSPVVASPSSLYRVMSQSETASTLYKLTPELWAVILSHLLPNQVEDFERTDPYVCVHHYFKHQQFMIGQESFPSYSDDKDSDDNPCIHGFAKYQAFLRQMPLVCKEFAAIFRENPCFSQSLTLGKTTGTTSDRDSLLDWVRQAGRHVRILSVNNSVYCENTEGMIAALASSPGLLPSVLLSNCHSMSELALFTSIQTLALECPEDPVDLDPLQALNGLQKSYLAGGFTPFHQGRYSCTTLPGHLTSLCLYGTQLFVERENSCDTMLKKLALYDSALIVEHDKLMSAYEGLEELHLHRSNVYIHKPRL